MIDKSWEESGLCRINRLGPDFFDDYGPTWSEAKRLCAMSPVRWQCLQENLDEPWGIFGGLNANERKAFKEGAAIRWCDKCGRMFARSKSISLCMMCIPKSNLKRKAPPSPRQIIDATVELMRRHLARGGTPATFSRRYGIPHGRAHQLERECRDTADR
jgi:hypothetical protein